MLTMRGPSRLIVRHTACAVKASGAAATAAAAKMAQAVGASKKPGDRPSQLQEAEQQEDKPAAAGHNDDLGLPQRLASIEPAAFARAAAAAAESRGSLEPLSEWAGWRVAGLAGLAPDCGPRWLTSAAVRGACRVLFPPASVQGCCKPRHATLSLVAAARLSA